MNVFPSCLILLWFKISSYRSIFFGHSLGKSQLNIRQSYLSKMLCFFPSDSWAGNRILVWHLFSLQTFDNIFLYVASVTAIEKPVVDLFIHGSFAFLPAWLYGLFLCNVLKFHYSVFECGFIFIFLFESLMFLELKVYIFH